MGTAIIHALTEERTNLCLPGADADADSDFVIPTLGRPYSAAESAAAEKLICLKADLRDADAETFWPRLLDGITDIAHAQYGFVVAKRMEMGDDDDDDTDSHLHGVALYHRHPRLAQPVLHRDFKYSALGWPCSHIKHDRVFVISERMSDLIPIGQTGLLPLPPEAYLGVPLLVKGRYVAHFGLMWTQDGLYARDLPWANTELTMHSLEDMVLERLSSDYLAPQQRQLPTPEGKPSTPRPPTRVTTAAAATTTPSLKPFARSLSHELRTPMHGVVGMLDVMHATVQEQIESSATPKSRQIFESLRDDIETIQVSCKRAVEAADNVVHAYDMNMQIPATPLGEIESPVAVAAAAAAAAAATVAARAAAAVAAAGASNTASQASYFDYKPTRLIEGNNTCNPHKRRRTGQPEPTQSSRPFNPAILRHVQQQRQQQQQQQSRSRSPASPTPAPRRLPRTPTMRAEQVGARFPTPPGTSGAASPSPGLAYCSVRELIPDMIHECLQVGDRPESVVSEPTAGGERIEVRSRSSNGGAVQKTIEWSVGAGVPATVAMEERDMSKLVSAVVLNAVKFTEAGTIRLTVELTPSKKSLMIDCVDTGTGIPADFQPQLFKPFSREDDSTTRAKEGLGLGLLVAKGLARRLGGDLTLVRSDVSGPRRGSHFEIRVPLEQATAAAASSTPVSTRADTRPVSTTPVNRGITALSLESPPAAAAAAPAAPAHDDADKAGKGNNGYDRKLAEKYPLSFLIAEDNKINRKLLVSMLGKLGYTNVHEAFDGREAVRIVRELYGEEEGGGVDVVLMDLWMPEMDGYQATEEILRLCRDRSPASTPAGHTPRILAVSADVTDGAVDRATRIGMHGFLTKPYKLMDLQRLITEFARPDEN